MGTSVKIGMSPEITTEFVFMLQAVFLGLILYAMYDCLRILRKVVRHGKVSTGLEDILYWMINTYLIFKLLFKYNYGIIRWFVIVGVGMGMFICKLALGNRFVEFSAKSILKIIKPIKNTIFSIKKRGKVLKKMIINSKVIVYLHKRRGGTDLGVQKKKKQF